MRRLTRLTIACLALTGCGGSGSGPAVTSAPPPENSVIQIQDVQGSGDFSPLAGRSVTIAGVVTGDFQDGDADTQRNLAGFFIQDELSDADPSTSGGVFVYDGPTPTVNVNPGDCVGVTGTVDERFGETQIAATSESLATGGRFTVAVNHLKSKGSPCDDIGDPDLGDGQGNCNITRRDAVLAMIDWLATDPTASMDADLLIIGDMNAYLAEDPVIAFENAGFTNLLASAIGSTAYSFVFAGQAGTLDHAFASPSLAGQVSGVAIWHINADESRALDYNLEFDRDPGLFDASSPIRASDHDPVIIGLDP